MRGREFFGGILCPFHMTEGNEPMKNNRFVAAVLIPGFVFMLIFAVFPVAYGLGISFYDYNPASTHNLFLGIENYKRLIQDETFWKAVRNTVFFCVAAVAGNIVITLFLAKIISVLPSKRLKTLFRTILFIPCIAPMVGTSMVWKYGIVGTDGVRSIKFLHSSEGARRTGF